MSRIRRRSYHGLTSMPLHGDKNPQSYDLVLFRFFFTARYLLFPVHDCRWHGQDGVGSSTCTQ